MTKTTCRLLALALVLGVALIPSMALAEETEVRSQTESAEDSLFLSDAITPELKAELETLLAELDVQDLTSVGLTHLTVYLLASQLGVPETLSAPLVAPLMRVLVAYVVENEEEWSTFVVESAEYLGEETGVVRRLVVE